LYLAVITVCASVSQGIMGKSHRRPENPCRNVCVHASVLFSQRDLVLFFIKMQLFGNKLIVEGFWVVAACLVRTLHKSFFPVVKEIVHLN